MSYASVQFLVDRLRSNPANMSGKIWIPSIESVDVLEILDAQDIEVVLFGDAFRILLEVSTWPTKHRYRLWTLSRRFCEGLIQILGLPVDKIGIIDRKNLFNLPQKIEWPKKPEGFIFAGRFAVPAKRIDVALATVEAFNNLTGWNIPFIICGSVQTEHPLNRALDRFNKQAQSSKTKVVNYGDLKSDWVLQFNRRYIFVSASIYEFEDCGVSAGQALEQQWPVILSDWGGHCDFQVDGIKFGRPCFSHEENEIQGVASESAHCILSSNVQMQTQLKSRVHPTYFARGEIQNFKISKFHRDIFVDSHPIFIESTRHRLLRRWMSKDFE